MNKTERQLLINQYEKWLQDVFLTEEEELCGVKMPRAEWEGLFDRLSSVFATFALTSASLDRLQPYDLEEILFAYGNHVHGLLSNRTIEHGINSPHEKQTREGRYYFWPVARFIYSKLTVPEHN